MQWYYAVGEQRQGPVAEAEFAQLVASGAIKPETLVWRQGMANWQPYSSVAAGAPEAGAVSATETPGDDTAVCAVSGQRRPKREMIHYEGKWISAEHRDEYFQRLREGVALPGQGAVPGPFGYGGFWRRFCAKFVDGVILWVISMPIALALGLGVFGRGAVPATSGRAAAQFFLLQAVFQGLGIAIGVGFEIFFIRKFDATPGKMAMGLKLLRADGGKLGAARIVGRYFAQWVSAIILGIGYIMAAFDEEKRALHDRICDTRVIKTR